MLVHGTGDKIVPYSQAVKLEERLTELNIPNKLITIPGADHDLNFKDVPTRTMVFNEIDDWARKYGK